MTILKKIYWQLQSFDIISIFFLISIHMVLTSENNIHIYTYNILFPALSVVTLFKYHSQNITNTLEKSWINNKGKYLLKRPTKIENPFHSEQFSAIPS